MEIISSKENAVVKDFCLLLNNKKERKNRRLFVAEGARFCYEAAISNVNIISALITPDFSKNQKNICEAIANKCNDIKYISENISKKISGTISPQGVYCMCEIQEHDNACINRNKYILIENLRDPGNVGTIIRTAQAFGLDGVICLGDCADVYSPKVLRSTMGTIFKMPLYFFESISEMVDIVKKNKFSIYCAILDNTAENINNIIFSNKSICCIGNEAKGLSEELKENCDKGIYIDMPGDAESLNAAVAASIIMWEMIK